MEETYHISPLKSEREINKQWLKQVLSYKLGSPVEIHTWSVESLEKNDGLCSKICYVKVSYTSVREGGIQTKNLAVKLYPEREEAIEFMRKGKLGQREVEFYKHSNSVAFKTFCEKVGRIRPVPDVYWADRNDNMLTIVLTDLFSSDYEYSAPAEGNTLDQIKHTLSSLAIVHASGVADIQKHGTHALDVPWDSNFLDSSVKIGLESLIKMYEGTPKAKIFQSMLPHLNRLVSISPSTHFLQTLIHGDLWATNIFFAADKSACLIDWQFSHIGNPLCDLATLFFLSSEPGVHTKHLMEVLRHYWENFEQALQKNECSVDLCFQNLLDDLDFMWMYGFMFLCAAFPDMIPNGQMTEERLRANVSFLYERDVFAKFLKSCS